MESIWHRPLTKRFWIIVGVILGTAVLVVSIGPVVVTNIEWSRHQSFDYRGEKIDLPFGWVYDSGQLPSTFTKRTLFVLNGGMDSSIFIDKVGSSHEASSAYLDRWNTVHKRNGFSAATATPVEKDPGHRTLLCSQQEEPKFTWLVVHCVVDDASWMFMYTGSQRDTDAAKAIMASAVSHDRH